MEGLFFNSFLSAILCVFVKKCLCNRSYLKEPEWIEGPFCN